MKLWEKGNQSEKFIEEFTVGQDPDLDLYLAPYDILGSIAHVLMLKDVGLLEDEETSRLQSELITLYRESANGHFTIENGIEDVHSQVEAILSRRLGDTGKKIHTGRSRNDQVLVDLHLFIRDQIREIVLKMKDLAETLLGLSEQYKNYLLPGYTHFQVAMPSSFGLWFGCFAESLADDLLVFRAAYHFANQNPLGSGAGFGTSFPINRKRTTELLGFDDLSYNVMYAMNKRGRTEKAMAQAISSVADTLGKLSSDLCMYMGQDFGFVSLPGKFTTGSSIMPHKSNPDVFELVRGYCNQFISLPNEISLIVSNLPTGYHRDFQLIKESFIPSIYKIKSCITIVNQILPELKIEEIDMSCGKYKYIFSVEEVNKLVMKGVPFRDAYREIADKIEKGEYQSSPDIKHTHEGSMGNLCNERISEKIQNRILEFNFEKEQKALQKLLEMNADM